MAVNAIGVLGLTRAKTELRIEPSITDHDLLLTNQISSAVTFVEKELGLPLIRRSESWPVEPASPDAPAVLQAEYVTEILQVRFWSPGPSLRDQADGTIPVAALGRTVQLGPYWKVWPPVGGWPERNRDSALYIDVVREVAPTPGGIVAACMFVLRGVYNGVSDFRPTAAHRAMMAPYRSFAIQPQGVVRL